MKISPVGTQVSDGRFPYKNSRFNLYNKSKVKSFCLKRFGEIKGNLS